MSQQDSPAAAAARAHVEAWSNHDYDAARVGLAPDVHAVITTVDPDVPKTDLSGIDDYMDGLVQFAQAVRPGTTRVTASVGDESYALLQVTSRVQLGPDAPEMTLHGARLYRLDEDQNIKDEQVVFFVTTE